MAALVWVWGKSIALTLFWITFDCVDLGVIFWVAVYGLRLADGCLFGCIIVVCFAWWVV